MAFFYYLLVLSIYISAIPVLIYLSFKKKYKQSIPARFFLKDNPPFKKHDIWFHACSLGEVISVRKLIEELKNDFDIDLSVITHTGFKEAGSIKGISRRYLPFEVFLPFWINKHSVLVVIEAELWPMLFYISKLKGAKIILLNARISDNSYSGYKKFSKFYKWVFSNIDIVFAQSQTDKNRLLELGAKDVRVIGNIKTAADIDVKKGYIKPEGKRVVVLASTHSQEEELILNNLNILSTDMIIVVPRHPERFDEVENFLEDFTQKRGLSFSRLSEENKLESDIVLCDLMGELVSLYAISDIVILGGSFVDGIGGHNPIEPAYFENVIISGEYHFNQNELFKLVENIFTCKAEDINVLVNSKDKPKKSKIKNRGDLSPVLKEIKNGKSI